MTWKQSTWYYCENTLSNKHLGALSHAWISEKLPASSQLNHYDPWISLDINSLDCWKPIWFNSILKTRICRPKTFSHTTLQQKAGVFMSPCLAYLLSILKTPTIWHWTRRARAKNFATTWSGRTTWWICKNNPPVGKCGRESCHGIMFNLNIYIYIRLTICNIGSCVFRKKLQHEKNWLLFFLPSSNVHRKHFPKEHGDPEKGPFQKDCSFDRIPQGG